MAELLKQKTAVVIGCGEIGMPIYRLCCTGFEQVLAEDLRLEDPAKPKYDVEVMHVALPGDLPDFQRYVVEYYYAYRPGIVIVHSTTPPGICDTIATELGLDNVVHSQVHGKHHGDRMLSDMLRYPKFVGTESEIAFQKAKDALVLMGHPPEKIRRLSSTQSGELVKLLSTSFFGYLIVWTQVVDRIARDAGVSFQELMSFTELDTTDFEIAGKFPGHIGGHCVIPNIELLKDKYPSHLWDFMIESNAQKALEDGEYSVEAVQNTAG